MHHRSIAVLASATLALVAGGCAHDPNKGYEQVLMPLQTGSTLHRRVLVPADHEKKTTKKKKPAPASSPKPKPEAEPSATPAPEEESTPPPDRFR
jgi:hypothetical protein